MGSIPNKYYLEVNSFYYGLYQLVFLVMWYCGTGGQIVGTTVGFAVRIIVIQLIGYSQEVTLIILVSKIVMILMFFLSTAAIAIVISYIMEL